MSKRTEQERRFKKSLFNEPRSANDQPAIRVTGITRKRELSAKLAADVEAFLANGGEIAECPMGVSSNPRNPAFNEPPEEAMFVAAN